MSKRSRRRPPEPDTAGKSKLPEPQRIKGDPDFAGVARERLAGPADYDESAGNEVHDEAWSAREALAAERKAILPDEGERGEPELGGAAAEPETDSKLPRR